MQGRNAAPPNMAMVEVVGASLAARDVVTLWLATPGTQRAPAPYQPGQFVTLALPGADGYLYRSYSLSSDGDASLPWEITVKRQRDGAVSNYLYDYAEPGMTIYASRPRGDFTLPPRLAPTTPLIFVAAGSGVAPIYGMLRALLRLPLARRPRAQLHYASSGAEDVIYDQELAELNPSGSWLRQWHYLSSQGERLYPERAFLRAGALTTAAHWYICGPESLKRSFASALRRRGVPAEQIHLEVFGGEPPAREPPASVSLATRASAVRRTPRASTALWLRIAGSAAALDVGADETLLESLERHGYRPAFSCRTGVCGVCRLRVLAGEVRQPNASGLSADERAAGYALTCVAHPVGPVTIESPGAPGAGAEAAPAARSPVMTPAQKVALRVGAAGAAIALFLGALNATRAASAPALAQQAQPTPQSATPAGTQTSNAGAGATGGVSKPAPTPTPHTSSGAS